MYKDNNIRQENNNFLFMKTQSCQCFEFYAETNLNLLSHRVKYLNRVAFISATHPAVNHITSYIPFDTVFDAVKLEWFVRIAIILKFQTDRSLLVSEYYFMIICQRRSRISAVLIVFATRTTMTITPRRPQGIPITYTCYYYCIQSLNVQKPFVLTHVTFEGPTKTIRHDNRNLSDISSTAHRVVKGRTPAVTFQCGIVAAATIVVQTVFTERS